MALMAQLRSMTNNLSNWQLWSTNLPQFIDNVP